MRLCVCVYVCVTMSDDSLPGLFSVAGGAQKIKNAESPVETQDDSDWEEIETQ